MGFEINKHINKHFDYAYHCSPLNLKLCAGVLVFNRRGGHTNKPLNLESDTKASVGLLICTDAVAQRVLRLAAAHSLFKPCVCRAGGQLHRASRSKHSYIMLLRHFSLSDVYRRGNKIINWLEARWIAS